jgi:Concanavalin A-like lectin/glucanases superfamily
MAFSNQLSIRLTGTPQSLSRAQTLGNGQKYTIAAWFKRSAINVVSPIASFGNNAQTFSFVSFNSAANNQITARADVGGATKLELIATAVVGDTNTWHHICLAIDTTQAVDANRAKLYLDGTQLTSFASTIYPIQNQALLAGGTWYYGRYDFSTSFYFQGWLDECHYIDGLQLTPSAFISGLPGGPKQYLGSFGAQGSLLRFEDPTSSITLGADSSGLGHNWTINGATSSTDAPVLIIAAPLITGSPEFGTPQLGQVHGLATFGLLTGSPIFATPRVGGRQDIVAQSMELEPPEIGVPNIRIWKTVSLGLNWHVDNAELAGPFQSSDLSNNAIAVIDGDGIPGPFRFYQIIDTPPRLEGAPASIAFTFAVEVAPYGRNVEIGLFDGTDGNRAWAIFNPRYGDLLYQANLGRLFLFGTRQEETGLGYRRLMITASTPPGKIGGYLKLCNEDLISDYVGDGISGVLVDRPKLFLSETEIREFSHVIAEPEIRFFWTVGVGTIALRWFRASSGQAGVDHHLEFGTALDLECVLQRWKPSHTQIVFDYSGLASGHNDPMSGTP